MACLDKLVNHHILISKKINLVRRDGGECEDGEHGDGGREEELEDAQRERQRHGPAENVDGRISDYHFGYITLYQVVCEISVFSSNATNSYFLTLFWLGRRPLPDASVYD